MQPRLRTWEKLLLKCNSAIHSGENLGARLTSSCVTKIDAKRKTITVMVIALTVVSFGLAACSQSHSSSSIASARTEIAGRSWDLTTYKNPGKEVTAAEANAAFAYTGVDAYEINDALRKGNSSVINRYATTIKNLASLINKSRSGKCKFYRFIDGDPNLLKQMKQAGQIFVDQGFISTTLERYPDDDGHFSSKEYVITGTSTRCADISRYSQYEGEHEVLFPPGTEFVVTKNMSGKNIYLREK